jgi:serine/threonine-protein kinase
MKPHRSLPPGLAARLDPFCDRFESAWLAGSRPRLEDYLAEAAEADRPALLRELLALELDYRARLGEQPTATEYHSRLPDFVTLIDEACAAASDARTPTPTSPPFPVPVVSDTVRTPVRTETVPRQAGRYVIEGEIARGGMGAVLRAHDPELGRPLAVKVLLEQHRGRIEFERRFRWEAQVTGRLQHPGIPPVHEAGTLPDGRPFFAMKLIKGRTLAELLKERDTPAADLPRFLSVFQQVCRTLAYAHSHRVIHRDLKPANVMVGAYGEVQVMDWGLAKVLGIQEEAAAEDDPERTVIDPPQADGSALTAQAGAVLGTPAYMAPEQARGEPGLDERCDVFGLGAILCVILTAQPPFAAASAAAVRRQAITGDLSGALAALDACGAEPDLLRLARSCLSARREERPANAQAVDEAVTAYLTGAQEKLHQAELARAAAALKATEERKRRRLTAILAAVAVVALLVTGVCWRWVEKTRDAARAQTAVQVNLELGRAASLRDQAMAIPLDDAEKRKESARLWDETLAAVDKAEAVLNAGPADESTRRHAEEAGSALRAEAAEAAADRTMLDRLEDARDQRGAIADEDSGRGDPQAVIIFGHAASDAYAAAFRAYGIDVLTLEPTEAAERIRRRGIHVALAAYLDDWLALEIEQPIARRLLAVSRAADPDPFRDRLRTAVADRDRAALKQLLRESAQLNLPLSAVLLLADGLHLVGELNEATDLLRRARRDHPRDFWVNDILGVYIMYADPTRIGEAERCFSAALALRPRSYFVWDNLGHVLTYQGRWSEAIEAYENCLRLHEDFLKGRLDLAGTLAMRGQPGDMDRAIALCDEVLRRKPQFALAYRERAAYFIEQGKKDEALASARRLVELAGDKPWSHLCLAGVLLLRGELPQAEAAFRRARELGPNLGDSWVGLGYVALARNEDAQAEQAFQEAQARSPNHPDVYQGLAALHAQRKQWAEADAALRRAIALRPAAWYLHEALGDLRMRHDAAGEAIPAYREALRLRPTAASSWNGLGNALHYQGSYEQAVEAYRSAIRNQPDNPIFHNNLGGSLTGLGRHQEAFGAYQEAVQLAPTQAEYQVNAAMALAALHQPDAACAYLLRAIDQEPDNAAPRRELGLLLSRLGRYADAADLFKQAADRQPDSAVLWDYLGEALRHDGQYVPAAEAYRKAVQLEPGNSLYHTHLGSALRLQGRDAEAVTSLRRALQLKPDNAWAHNEIGLTLHQLGRFDEAIAAFRQSLLSQPADAVVRVNLGMTLSQMGRADEAADCFRQAVKDDRRSAPAHYQLAVALFDKGRFQDARAEAEAARTLARAEGQSTALYDHGVHLCDRMIALEPKREAILTGGAEASSSAERLLYAQFCFAAGRPAAAVSYYSRVFADDPSQAEASGNRGWAVLAAVRAGGEAEGDEPVRLRRLALGWLREELAALKRRAESSPGARKTARQTAAAWRSHPALAGVRDPHALANLPAAERAEWRAFWNETETLVKEGPGD